MSLFANLFTFDTDAPDNSIVVFARVQTSAPINPLAAEDNAIFATARETISILTTLIEHLPHPPLVQLAAHFGVVTGTSTSRCSVESGARTRSRSIVKHCFRRSVQPSHPRFTCTDVDVPRRRSRGFSRLQLGAPDCPTRPVGDLTQPFPPPERAHPHQRPSSPSPSLSACNCMSSSIASLACTQSHVASSLSALLLPEPVQASHPGVGPYRAISCFKMYLRLTCGDLTSA